MAAGGSLPRHHGLTLWVLQPIVILLALRVVDVVLVAKVAALGVCLVANFLSYRLLVWRPEDTTAGVEEAASI